MKPTSRIWSLQISRVIGGDLEHAHEVGMAGTWASLALQVIGSIAHGSHAVRPVGEVVVHDLQRDGRAKRPGEPHTGEDARGIMLDLLPTTTTVAALTTREIAVDRLDVDGYASGNARHDGRECRPVRLACCDKLHASPLPYAPCSTLRASSSSRASTRFIAAMAHSIIPSSGGFVVRRCICMPGHKMIRTNMLSGCEPAHLTVTS